MKLITCNVGDKFTDDMNDAIHNAIPADEHITYRGELLKLNGVWNKMALFTIPGPCLYIDIDTIVHGPIPHFEKKPFLIWSAYWKRDNPKYYWRSGNTIINSSMMYWEGDQSHIWDYFLKNKDFFMRKYKGVDRFLFWEKIDYDLFEDGIMSSHANPWKELTPLVTYNGEDFGQYFQGN